jgi:hypothetical protein
MRALGSIICLLLMATSKSNEERNMSAAAVVMGRWYHYYSVVAINIVIRVIWNLRERESLRLSLPCWERRFVDENRAGENNSRAHFIVHQQTTTKRDTALLDWWLEMDGCFYSNAHMCTVVLRAQATASFLLCLAESPWSVLESKENIWLGSRILVHPLYVIQKYGIWIIVTELQ